MDVSSQPPPPQQAPDAEPLLRTLVFSDLVDRTDALAGLGDRRATDLVRHHDRLVRSLLHEYGGREIEKTDGFLAMFERPAGAVGFALAYQRALREFNASEGAALAARIGLHVGDVLCWDNAPVDVANGAKLVEVEGQVKLIAARLMALALPSQILLSGVAHALVQAAHDSLEARFAPLRWRQHGRYRLKGVADPVAVFEVGEPAHAPLRPPGSPGKAHREVPLWRRPATLVVGAASSLALAVAASWHLLQPQPAIEFAQRDWVVVGDVRNLTADPALGQTIDTAFRIGLEQSRYVNVMSDLKVRQTVGLMRKDPETTAIDRAIGSEIAIRDGAHALILPSVAEVGRRVRVTAEVVDPRTLATVWSEFEDGTGVDSVLRSLDNVNRKLRLRLGEALTTVSRESKPLDKVATRDLDALRAYSLGVTVYAEGDYKQAIALFRRAIELDPEFALARLNLGDTLLITGGGDETAAIAEVQQAIALGDRLSPRDALYAQAWLANFENPRAALEQWQLLARLYPDFTMASGAYGFYAYYSANRFDTAIAEIERNAVDSNPNRTLGDYLLASLYLGNERYADAARRFELARASGIANQGAYQAYLYAAQRQFERAEQILRAGKRSGIAAEEAQEWYPRIAFALDRGEWGQARSTLTQALHDTAALNGTLHREFALIELGVRTLSDRDGDYRKVLKAAVDALLASAHRQSADSQFGLLFVAYLAAHSGAVELAQSALSGIEPFSRSGDYPYLADMLGLAEAELATRRGDAALAVALLAPRINGSEFYFSHKVLMDAYAAQGNDVAALAEAQWLARHRGRAYAEQYGQATLKPFNVALSTLALLDAAEFNARLGNKDAARASLVELRKAWPQADQRAFLQPRLRALEEVVMPGPR